ncbi:hypothetical protein [Pontibacter akesuensis]|nr:hypothetical protein [Pontibacter akesuensis]
MRNNGIKVIAFFTLLLAGLMVNLVASTTMEEGKLQTLLLILGFATAIVSFILMVDALIRLIRN